MKINLRNVFCTVSLSFGFLTASNAQIFFTQDFQGATGANGLPAGWNENGLSTDGIYFVGTNVQANAGGYWPVPAHTNFAMSNDDVCNCDKSADRIILPPQNFTTLTGVEIIYDYFLSTTYGGAVSMQVSTDGGTTWNNVLNLPSNNTLWQDNTVTNLNAYLPFSNVLISFLYNDGGAWGQGFALDNVRLNQIPGGVDLQINNSTAQYTIIPQNQANNMSFDLDIENTGGTGVTDAEVTLNVFESPNFITPVATYTSGQQTVGAGSTVSFTVGNFTPANTGQFRFEFAVSTALPDLNANNDSLTYDVLISNKEYARDNGNVIQSVGGSNTIQVNLGNVFDIYAPTYVDSILFAVNGGPLLLGDTTGVFISTTVAGVPTNTVLGQSMDYIFTAADTLSAGAVIKLAVVDGTNNPVLLTPGRYFFGVKESLTGENIGLLCTDEIFTGATVYANINGGAYSELNTLISGFNYTPIVRPSLFCSAQTTDVQNSCGNFTWIDGNTYSSNNNTATYVYPNGSATGCDSIVTLDLTIFTPASSTDMQTACNEFTWIDGNTYTTSNNTATYTYTAGAVNGCDSIVTLDLTINTSTQPTILNSNNVLTASPSGLNYNWIDCSDSSIISGETNVSYTPTVAGSYAVITTDANGCTDTSACEISTVSLNEFVGFDAVVAPNPTNGKVLVNFASIEQISIRILDYKGSVILDSFYATANQEIDLSQYQAGVYIMEFLIGDKKFVSRIIKE